MQYVKILFVILVVVVCITCRQEDKYYLIGFPDTPVYPNINVNPKEEISLPYLTPVK